MASIGLSLMGDSLATEEERLTVTGLCLLMVILPGGVRLTVISEKSAE